MQSKELWVQRQRQVCGMFRVGDDGYPVQKDITAARMEAVKEDRLV
jgi:hypothetical protein